MKGMVFTEFLNFVDAEMGPEMVDQIIDDCGEALSTGGAYTAVGTYPCSEMGALLTALAHRSGTPPPDLLRSFGKSLAVAFSESYRGYFTKAKDLFDFISRIDNYIHVEVLKLYPDAELPSFEVISKNHNKIVLKYRSPRALHDLATGLFLASAEHYGEKVDVAMAFGGVPGETTFEITRLGV